MQNPDLLKYFRADSAMGKKGMTYFFTGVPKNCEGTDFVEVEHNIRPRRCMILTAIVPKEYAGKETRYFSEWILSRVKSKTMLNERSLKLFDSIAGTSADKDSITCALFSYVRDYIKYHY